MRVLLGSGGGRFGAWQAGSFQALVRAGNAYDCMCGVSVGAINCALMSQYAPPMQYEGAARCWELWSNLKGTSDVYATRFLDWIGALLGSTGGRFDDAPLRRLIRANFSPAAYRASGVQLHVGFVDLGAREYLTMEGSDPRILEGIAWSAAFPVAVSPSFVRFRNRDCVMVDGGIRNQLPIAEAFSLPGEITAIDAVCCQPPDAGSTLWSVEHGRSVLGGALRVVETMSAEILRTDLLELRQKVAERERAQGRPIKLRVFAPKAPLVSDPLDFSPSYTRVLLQQGYKETEEQLRSP